MKVKIFFLLVLASAMLLFNACRNDYGAPGEKVTPLIFDESEKTISFEKQNVVFTCNNSNFFVDNIREISGSDTIKCRGFYYVDGVLNEQWYFIAESDTSYRVIHSDNKLIKGDWYEIHADNVSPDKKKIMVNIAENESDDTRKLILDIVAGNTGNTLKIIQNHK